MDMQHVIRKQVIHIQASDSESIHQLQQETSRYYYSAVIPVLEKIFDELCSEDQVLVFDHIEIDMGILKSKGNDPFIPESELYPLLRKQFEKYMEDVKDIQSGRQYTNDDGDSPLKKTQTAHAFDQWLYYMQHGLLPWNMKQTNEDLHIRVLETLSTNLHSVSRLTKQIRLNPSVALRIIRLHTEDFLVNLIEAVTAKKQSELSVLIALISEAFQDTIQHAAIEKLWLTVLTEATGNHDRKDTLKLLQRAIAITYAPEYLTKYRLAAITEEQPQLQPLLLPFIHSATDFSNKQTSDPDAVNLSSYNEMTVIPEPEIHFHKTTRTLLEEGIFVQHAGLTLLHPFYQFLFRNTGLTKGGVFVDRLAQQKALYLLHYIATGEKTAEEHLLAQPKIICGWSLTEPVLTAAALTESMIIEADDLIRAAIAQWTILKNTSIEGLRESFLQREGKVFTKAGKLYIQVEKKSIDMLLDHLPWNTSIVKFPWLNDILWVEWR
jgi:hypothetical protein